MTIAGCLAMLGGALGVSPSAASAAAWSIQSVSPPAATLDTTLSRVSCPSANACTTVGSYGTADVTRGFGYLSGVSCPSAQACTSVGAYIVRDRTQATLSERGTPQATAILLTPNQAGGGSDTLSAVSCASQNACTAVGNYLNESGTRTALVERYS